MYTIKLAIVIQYTIPTPGRNMPLPIPALAFVTFFDMCPKGIFEGWIEWALSMSSNVGHRMAYYPSVLINRAPREIHNGATAALALAIRITQSAPSNPRGVILRVLREIGGWGKIGHVNRSFQRLAWPGAFERRSAFSRSQVYSIAQPCCFQHDRLLYVGGNP